MAYILVTKEFENTKLKRLIAKLKNLLRELEDIFPEEFPQEIPPTQGIELILVAPILNKPPYNCNLEETREMQRQIDELMEIWKRKHEPMCCTYTTCA